MLETAASATSAIRNSIAVPIQNLTQHCDPLCMDITRLGPDLEW